MINLARTVETIGININKRFLPFFLKMGIPFTDLVEAATLVRWKMIAIPLLELTIRGPFRRWMSGFATMRRAHASSVVFGGLRALGVRTAKGLGSYETAWTWLHKLRRAMVRPGRDRLTGSVEVDGIYVGGPEEGVRGRDIKAKTIVAVAAEKTAGRGIGRVRLRRIEDVSGDSLIAFIKDFVVSGSMVQTDGWSGYANVTKTGYKHQIVIVSRGTGPAHEVLPRVHRAASLLKRWLARTHRGGRQSKARGLFFARLAQQALAVGSAPYRDIVAPENANDTI